jgi:hypothetical protein
VFKGSRITNLTIHGTVSANQLNRRTINAGYT